MPSKRVGLVHTNFMRGGGMEAYLLSLVEGFNRHGDQVTVYACKVDKQLARELGCRVIQIRPFLPRKIREFRFLSQCNSLNLREKFDISLGLARTDSVHMAICGGVHAETMHHVRRTAIFRHFYDTIELEYERRAFEHTPCIMAHSLLLEREILSHYQVPASKIHVIYPPVVSDRFYPLEPRKRRLVRQSLGLTEKCLAFLFVSCGHQRKGLPELIKAFSMLDPSKYILLVVGKPMRDPGIANVRYLGYRTDMVSMYGAADYTILPSHYEPFGLVVPESMQCGTPVITTLQVGATELLVDEPSIQLEDNTPNAIRAAVERIKPGLRVEPGFVTRHCLDIDQHIDAIKKNFG